MSFPRYESYKDSGVEWLGEVPAHWEVKRLKQVANVFLSNVDKHTVDGQRSVRLCNYMDAYKNSRITTEIDFMRATASNDQIERLSLRKGDVIITKDSEDPSDIGVPALVAENISELVCGYHLAIVRSIASVGGLKAFNQATWSSRRHYDLIH